MPDSEIKELSEREGEILRLVARGASNKEIAQELFISANTVKVHLRNIFAKIGVASRTEAAMYAVKIGLVQTVTFERQGELPPSMPPALSSLLGEATPTPALAPPPPAELPKPAARRTLWQGVMIAGVVVILGLVGFFARRGGLSALSATGSPAALATSPRWQEKTALPTARFAMAVVAYENRLYAIGGEGREGVSDVVESYDVARDVWGTLAPKPLPVAEVSGAVIGGRIFVPGGRLPSGEVSDALEIYDPRLDRWEPGAPLPVPISGYALVAFEGKLYLFGGWDGQQYLASVLEYDPQGDEWLARTPMPTARAFAGAASAAGKIYVFGGYDGKAPLAINEVYQPDRDQTGEYPWGMAAPLPEGRYAMGATSLADIVLVVGGESSMTEFTALEYFPQQDLWQVLEPLGAQPPSHLGLAALETKLYLLGGRVDGNPITQNLAYQAIYTVAIPVLR
jgi:DNA-binding CsgD family transcriptional regulator